MMCELFLIGIAVSSPLIILPMLMFKLAEYGDKE